MSRVAFVLCGRVRDGRSPIPGAQVRTCGKCGEPIWCSPTTLDQVAKGADLICLHCPHPDLPVIQTEAQRQEIAAAGLRGRPWVKT